jgi:hypothetical protein
MSGQSHWSADACPQKSERCVVQQINCSWFLRSSHDCHCAPPKIVSLNESPESGLPVCCQFTILLKSLFQSFWMLLLVPIWLSCGWLGSLEGLKVFLGMSGVLRFGFKILRWSLETNSGVVLEKSLRDTLLWSQFTTDLGTSVDRAAGIFR